MLNIILVNYNNSQDTINCIESILNLNKFIDINIFVFDNASSDDEKKILKNFINEKKELIKDFIKIKFNETNSGFAHGNNYFIQQINKGEYIWILNNDTLVNSELIEKISSNLPTDNEVLYFNCHTFDNEFHDTGLHYVNLITGQSKMKKTNRFDFEYVCGASFIIKKTENTPLFDESYFLYYEDCDYGMLLNKNSYNYRKLNDVYFLHKIGGSGEKQKKKINLIQLRSQVLFMKRYSPCFIVYFFVKSIILLMRREFKSLLFFFSSVRKIKCDFSLH